MPETNNDRRVALIILDGWGLNKKYPGNAIALAKTPTFDKLWQLPSTATLAASGEAVGLPAGQMGTSEVNHFTIGAGRIVFQDLVRINKSIADGDFFQNQALVDACQHAKKYQSGLHILGLLSDGGVHSHQKHFWALLKLAKEQNIQRVFFHIFTDGRDTAPQNSPKYIQRLKQEIKKQNLGKIKSVIGRYYAMDRDHNWDRTDQAFDLLTQAKGKKFADALTAVSFYHQKNIGDEFITASWIDGEDGKIRANDAIIFANFRNDRPRQLTERLLKKGPKNLFIATMTQYHPDYKVAVAFRPITINNSLGKIISDHHLTQLRVTETEKFAHMTFFLNCKREEPFPQEDRVMFHSYQDIKTHDEKPYMRAPEIADKIVEEMKKKKYAAIFSNICNADMVGHTGNIPAAIQAAEAADQALAQIVAAARNNDYDLIITADHGNADEMLTEDGKIITSHSLNPVPLIIVSRRYQTSLTHEKGKLIDIAPTVLTMLNLPVDPEMTGRSFV